MYFLDKLCVTKVWTIYKFRNINNTDHVFYSVTVLGSSFHKELASVSLRRFLKERKTGWVGVKKIEVFATLFEAFFSSRKIEMTKSLC